MPRRTDCWADLLLRHRAWMLVVVGLLSAFFASRALTLKFSTSPETILESTYEDLAGLRDHERALGTFEHRVVLAVGAEDVFAPGCLARIARATRDLAALPEVSEVRSLAATGYPLPAPETDAFRDAVLGNRLLSPFLVAADGRTAAILVELKPEADGPQSREGSLALLARTARAAGLDPLVSGVPAVRVAYAEYIRKDLFLLPPMVTAILLGLLYAAFRRLKAVLALLGVVGLASVWTVGAMALTGGRITALTAILPSLILVVGIAAGVHVVSRFREARVRGCAPVEASREAMTTMLLPCGLTALTTAVGFSSLLVARIRDVREFGIYSAVGAVLAFALGVPLVGVLLSFDRADRPADPGVLGDGPLRRLGIALVRRPMAGVLLGALLVALSAGGIFLLKSDTFLLEDIRAGSQIDVATHTVDRELGGVIGFDLVVECPDGLLSPEQARWFREIEDWLRLRPGVRGVVGPGTLLLEAARSAGMADGVDGVDGAAPLVIDAIEGMGAKDVVRGIISADRRLARVVVRTGDVGSDEGDRIRQVTLTRALATAPAGVTVRIAGLAVLAENLLGRLVREMGRSTALAFLVIFFLMSVVYRSVGTGALAMVPNFLPLLAAAGFMGYAGITIRSSIALIFAVGLGIAVDDTIHMLSRYRAERRAGRQVRSAVLRTVRWTGRPVVLTSAILFAGFLAFLVSGFKATEQFGVISAVTIAAALVGDLLLLPALLLIAGRRRKRN